MGRLLFFALILLAIFGGGYFAGSMRRRVDTGALTKIERERDRAQIALHIAHGAIRTALRDPALEPQTSVTLDDARQEIETALPKGHLQ